MSNSKKPTVETRLAASPACNLPNNASRLRCRTQTRQAIYGNDRDSSPPAACLLLALGWHLRNFFRRGWLLRLRQTFLQRSHQIHHRGQLLRLFDGLDFAALELSLNQLLRIILTGVVIFFRLPLPGQRFNELVRNLDFSVFNLHIRSAERLDLTNFLRVVHGVQHHSTLMRAEENSVFAVVHGEFGDGDILALLQRLGEQRIRAASGFFGNHVIRRLEVHGIHFARLHEFEDLHRLRGLRLDLLDFLRLDDDVFVLAILVALDDIAALEDLVVRRANELLLYPMVIGATKLVERNAAAARA